MSWRGAFGAAVLAFVVEEYFDAISRKTYPLTKGSLLR